MKMIHIIIIGIALVALYLFFLKPKEAKKEISVEAPKLGQTTIIESGCGGNPC